MMRYELGLESPVPERAVRSALTNGLSYVVGRRVPLAVGIGGIAATAAFRIARWIG